MKKKLQSAENIKNTLLAYANKNQCKQAIDYIHNNIESIKSLSDTFGKEVNPYLRPAYDAACFIGNDKFALEYQKDLEMLLGNNILFLDE